MIKAVSVKGMRALVWSAVCVLTVACASQSDSNAPPSMAAAVAPEPVLAAAPATAAKDNAIAAYQDYLTRYPNSSEYDSIARRLADLLVEQAADKQLAQASTPEDARALEEEARKAYAEAIKLYEYLLQKNPHAPGSTAILYQLSRAYEESGEAQPALALIDRLLAQELNTDARLYADTQFRQGELLFTERAYLAAGRAYQSVVDLGDSVPAYEQSLYKLGWSLFKQERYQEALPVLFAFLNRRIVPGTNYDEQMAGLSVADREQIVDILRVISRSFAQLGGSDAVSTYFHSHDGFDYQDQVYLDLADWYVEQEQISEAARTWLALAQRHPLAAQAPHLTARAIDIYRQAGFQRRMLELEARFVQAYGMGGDFWGTHSAAEFPQVVQLLQSSLRELARVSHERARLTGNADDVRQAQQWYRQYLVSFGDYPEAAELNFQLAELLYESGLYRQALEEYERTAWSRGAHSWAVDAALGGLHANEKIMENADAAGRTAATERTTTQALRFVTKYPEHPAAPGLLAQSATALLQQQEYNRALDVSDKALLATASESTLFRQVAWSLRAQALFATEDYPGAAAAYTEALQLAEHDDERRPALQKGLALATYRQAGQALALDDKQGAAELYQQAADLAPEAALRSKAAYDMATTLLALESWPEAISVLEQFRNDFPDDPLQGDVAGKLAYALERNGDVLRAAGEYLRMGQDEQQAEALQREALLRAAALYIEAGDVAQGVVSNEYYIKRFPKPAAVAVDVMQQLADLESTHGDTRRRHYWLEEIIRLDRKVESSATHLPAAQAALELAEYQLAAFDRIRLVDPVQDNLAEKIAAMKRALREFEAAIAYDIYPVTTAATFHIASMYEALGRALLNSERPVSLTKEELSEYNLLLIQQAAPFEQQAIEIYTRNTQRADGDQRDPWVEKSVQQLAELQDGR